MMIVNIRAAVGEHDHVANLMAKSAESHVSWDNDLPRYGIPKNSCGQLVTGDNPDVYSIPTRLPTQRPACLGGKTGNGIVYRLLD